MPIFFRSFIMFVFRSLAILPYYLLHLRNRLINNLLCAVVKCMAAYYRSN